MKRSICSILLIWGPCPGRPSSTISINKNTAKLNPNAIPQCNNKAIKSRHTRSIHQVHHQNLLHKLLRILGLPTLLVPAPLPLRHHLLQLLRRYTGDFPRRTERLVFVGRPSQTVERDEEWTQESDSQLPTHHGHGGPGEED